jgi:hypothetical protein
MFAGSNDGSLHDRGAHVVGGHHDLRLPHQRYRVFQGAAAQRRSISQRHRTHDGVAVVPRGQAQLGGCSEVGDDYQRRDLVRRELERRGAGTPEERREHLEGRGRVAEDRGEAFLDRGNL